MKSVFGKDYAFFYDLFYKDKDYEKESRCLASVFNKLSPKRPHSVLDIACGTGSHSNILAQMGYSVTGVDASSYMLKHARLKAKQKSLKVKYLKMRMENLNLGKRFDVIISMFTIVDYITESEKLVKFFSNVQRHMKKNSLYIFDFWNRSAVLRDYIPYKKRKFECKDFVIRRESHTTVHPIESLIKINYNVSIFDKLKGNKLKKRFREMHALRFYSIQEIKSNLARCGLKAIKIFPFINPKQKLKPYDWDIVVCAKRSY